MDQRKLSNKNVEAYFGITLWIPEFLFNRPKKKKEKVQNIYSSAEGKNSSLT